MGSSVSDLKLTSRFIASRTRDLSDRQQVAAVCYRISNHNPEFLLVRTRGGRWIFPKGGVEPGLSHAQSAALEAFEEAGVHGRIELTPFARYQHLKSKDDSFPSRRAKRKPVIAHLCEVSHLERPQEANRKPTWFSAEKAKKRLLKDRAPELGEQLAAVVDHAVSRIQRYGNGKAESKKEELQRASLESHATTRMAAGSAALIRYFFQTRNVLSTERIDIRRKARAIVAGARKISRIEPIRPLERIPLRLTAGSQPAEIDGNVARIDRARTVSPTKLRNSSSR